MQNEKIGEGASSVEYDTHASETKNTIPVLLLMHVLHMQAKGKLPTTTVCCDVSPAATSEQPQQSHTSMLNEPCTQMPELSTCATQPCSSVSVLVKAQRHTSHPG